MALYNPIMGQTDQGLAIGLDPHTYYFVNVQVFNTAGNGPKSEDYLEETLRSGESSGHEASSLSKWLSAK